MQTEQAMMEFTEAERPTGERLIKIALEIDRIEGYSSPHSIAMTGLCKILGIRMGMHGIDLSALKFAALVHDIGERAMKRNYLLRPNPLTWEETLDLWRHPILGEQAAADIRLSRQTQLLIRWHHEWWNGFGYPDGLSGESIPLGARILRAVDSYYAITSQRPHRERFSTFEAEEMIANLAGIEFDPLVVKELLAIFSEQHGSEALEIIPPGEEMETQILLTPDGLQATVIPNEEQFAEDEIEDLEFFDDEERPQLYLAEEARAIPAEEEIVVETKETIMEERIAGESVVESTERRAEDSDVLDKIEATEPKEER